MKDFNSRPEDYYSQISARKFSFSFFRPRPTKSPEMLFLRIQDKDIKDYYKKLLQAQKEDDHMILQPIQSDTFSTKSVILFLSLFTALLIIGDVLLWFRPPIGKIFMMITTTGLLLSIIIGGNISFHHRRNTEKTKKEKTHD